MMASGFVVRLERSAHVARYPLKVGGRGHTGHPDTGTGVNGDSVAEVAKIEANRIRRESNMESPARAVAAKVGAIDQRIFGGCGVDRVEFGDEGVAGRRRVSPALVGAERGIRQRKIGRERRAGDIAVAARIDSYAKSRVGIRPIAATAVVGRVVEYRGVCMQHEKG